MEFFPHDMICIAYRMIPTTMVGSVISMWGGFFFFFGILVFGTYNNNDKNKINLK